LRKELKRVRNSEELHFVDSNVFFYAKIMDKEYGRSSAEVLRKIQEGELTAATSVLVILEVANALKKFGLAKEVKDTVDSIFSLSMMIVNLDDSDTRNAIDIFHRHRISPYDCAHVAVMKHAEISNIISADKDFEHIPGIQRRDPKRIS
jgi:predicted nucleic acid-binding protein